MTRPPLGTVVVVAALGGLTLVGSLLGRPAASRVRTSQVEVVGATAVCPDLRQVKGILASRVSVGAAPLPAGRGGATRGKVEIVSNSARTAPSPLAVSEPGQVAVGVGTGIDQDALVVSAAGPLAAGLEAEQVTRGEGGRERGLAGLRCEPPRREAWFEGGSTVVGDESVLVLANVDDTPATVDVSVFSATGPADPRPGQGITVEPHSRRVILMDTIAPDRALLAVHVLSRQGRVAAALRHSRTDGSSPLGVDWVPQAAPPAAQVVVPGIPQGGNGQRYILITNPTTDDTVASVRITTQDGQYVPTGLDQVAVPAGTTVTARLDIETLHSALAATVTTDGVPVLAGGLVRDAQQGSKTREFAYTGASIPLSGPALMTDLVINRPTESTLILSAPQGKATVVVTPIQVLGQQGRLPAAKTVVVPAGRTAVLKLSTFYPPGTDAQLAVEVRPLEGSGPVYAARYLRERGAHGPLTTLLDLQGPAQLVPRLPAVLDQQAAD
ncbi:MAG: DUF5719 family protein [Mycobacteriales bacterium]